MLGTQYHRMWTGFIWLKTDVRDKNTVCVVMLILFLRDTSGPPKGIFCLMVVFLILCFKMSVFGL
jgi:hypothetical protein